MHRPSLSFVSCLCLIGPIACGSGSSSDGTGTESTSGETGSTTGTADVELQGALQKGPFVLGSSVAVSLLDATGDPTGEVFNTMTDNDLGEFEVTIPNGSLVSIQGSGFYYNEVTTQLSDAALTLRAYAELGEAATYLNLVTHLSYSRVEVLIEGGADFATARTQAEAELRAALQIGPAGFDPQADGTALNLLGGDNDANAYLFAVSAVLAQAAVERAGPTGSVDANLQEILNSISLDLSEDGELLATMQTEINAAEQLVDVQGVEQGLADRLMALGSSAPVPDLDRVLDSDNDDVANIDDNCPTVSNPTQEPVAGLCSLDSFFFEDTGQTDVLLGGAIGDFDGDGVADFVGQTMEPTLGESMGLMFFAGDGAGSFATGVVGPTLANTSSTNGYPPIAADMNGDGNLDLVLKGPNQGAWVVVHGDGGGGFSATTVELFPIGTMIGGLLDDGERTDVEIADFNGDGRADVAAVSCQQSRVAIALGNASGLRDAPTDLGIAPPLSRLRELGLADFDGDGELDLMVPVNGTDPLSPPVELVRFELYLGDGSGGFSAGSIVTSPNWNEVWGVDTGDVDADGDADLIASGTFGEERTYEVNVFNGDGAGAMAPPLVGPAPPMDQISVLALDSSSAGGGTILTGSTGFFQFMNSDGSALSNSTRTEMPVVNLFPRFSKGDVDGDGHLDAIVSSGSSQDQEFSFFTLLVNG